VLILPGVSRLPLATYRKIEEYAQHGGIVIATRSLPSTAPGLANVESESQQIRQISQRLFQASGAPGHFIPDENHLGSSLADLSKPDFVVSPRTPELGFIHRHLPEGDLYFIANSDNHSHHVRASFRSSGKNAESWDGFTGDVSSLVDATDLDLQPYESRLIFFSSASSSAARATIRRARPASKVSSLNLDLSGDWDVAFPGANQTVHMDHLRSWSDDESHRYYSGQVAYDKTITLQPNDLRSRLLLDFGVGTPVAKPDPLPEFNMRAYLEGPVREAAEVFVNGQRVGVVWHPPYALDVTKYLKAGSNALHIVVGNTAINALAGRALPDYRLLNARFGERFVPQGMDNLQPLPSGILGPLRLVSSPR